MVYIGIDLGGTGIKIGLVDETGKILCKGETPTGVGRPYEEIIGDMGQCMLKVMGDNGYKADDIAAIGIGIPGIADADGNVIFCTNMGWKNVPLSAELRKYLDKPVYIDNDATVAGFAEYICGVSAGSHSSVFLTLGTGVGGGIVIDGRPWSGFHGIGSEVGHIPMDIGGVPCTCGNDGCLERYTSATAIIRMGKARMSQYPDSLLNQLCENDPDKLTAKMVFDAAKVNDEAGLRVFNEYVDYLARACYTVIAFLDPEVIVLGGGVSKAGDFLLDAVRARIPSYLIFKDLPYSRIEIASLGNDAGIIGAAMLGRPAKEA